MHRLLALLALVLFAACANQDATHDHSDSLAAEHTGDSTAATAMVQPPRMPVETQVVNYGPATGYYAAPQDAAAAAGGLIVVHEWWGLNSNVRAMADRFAGEGYRVLAVDLYNGSVAQTPDSAMALLRQATSGMSAVRANLEQAYAFLEAAGAEKIGVLGWCFGGGMALQAALAMPDRLDATVIYYGQVDDATVADLRALQMPVRAFFGEADSSIPLDAVRQFEARLQEAGVRHEITTYTGAGHAFANPTGNNYQPGPAQDSWEKTLAFLAEHLK